MVDNIKNIKALMSFKNEGEFYFVQIFQRRKDNPDLKHGVIRLKSYCVYSYDELEELLPSIISYCERFNARAYFRLNKQNATDVTLRCIEQLSKNLREGNPHKGRKVWDSVAGQGGKRDYWVLDVDKEHIEYRPNIENELKSLIVNHFSEVRDMLVTPVINPTRSGFHLITLPFDTRIMNPMNAAMSLKHLPKIDIQKDANTLLYSL